MLLIAIIIGTLVGIYGAYTVVFIYKFKGTPKASMARVLGVSSGAVVASFGVYLLRYIFGDGEEPLSASIAFSVSAIISLSVFLWINRKKIG